MKKILAMLASWLAVLFLLGVLLEVSAWRWLPRVFPLASVMNYMDIDNAVLLQYSKRSAVPQDYIALLGDSYAFGQGDWLYNRQHERAPSYSAAHVLHDLTGRDVVSFGRPASSNIKGYLEDPLSQLAYLQHGGYDIADPALAVLFFYEGNDAVDNWKEFQVRYQGKGFDPARLADSANFSDFINDGILANNATMKKTSGKVQQNRLTVLPFLWRLARGESEKLWQQFRAWKDNTKHIPMFKPQPRDHNTVRVAGELQKIPDELQVPPVALHSDEMDVSMTVLAMSLHELRLRWPQTRFVMVYIPAVATAYDVVSDTVNIYDKERGKNYPSASLLPMSDATCLRVQLVAERENIALIDTRPAIRETARNAFVHGPVDWLHFNETGYRVLAGEIARYVAGDSHLTTECATITAIN